MVTIGLKQHIYSPCYIFTFIRLYFQSLARHQTRNIADTLTIFARCQL